MKAKVGSRVNTEFGIVKIVAITKQWIIALDKDGVTEWGLSIGDDWIEIPSDSFEEGGGQDGEIEVEENK